MKRETEIPPMAEEKLIELAQRVCEYFGEGPIESFLNFDIEMRALARTALAIAGIERRKQPRRRGPRLVERK